MASEIITLQLGSQANYVAAHFWNLQEEVLGSNWGSLSECINQEVLLSWYRPRTVVLDVSGALGGVSFSHDSAAATAAAAVAAEAEPGASWGGSLQVHQVAPAAKSRFRLELEAAGASDAANAISPVKEWQQLLLGEKLRGYSCSILSGTACK
eukprot:gene11404-11552_t